MEDIKETCLELPWEVVNECNGFGLDFGGSVCKVVYIHKDDWAEPSQRSKDAVQVRCVRFSRTEFDKALDYLKTRVCIRRKDAADKPVVFLTGIGGAQFAKQVETTFNVSTKNISELECFFAGFNFILRNNKRGQIVHEIDQEVVKKSLNFIRERARLLNDSLKDSKNMEQGKYDLSSMSFPLEQPFDADHKYVDYKDIFPCFLVMIGSNGGIFVVKEDGTYNFAADMMRGGRAFLGLASLLTKSKSFAEVMSKAEDGNMRSVHEYLSDITKTIDDSGENMYSEAARKKDSAVGERPTFMFGKTPFKEIDDFRSEDLARSLLSLTVNDIVQTAHAAARLTPGVKHVFFCGGFPDHPLTRSFIIEDWLERDGLSLSLFNMKELADLHFLKHGPYLGALGAFLNQQLRFTGFPQPAAGED